MRVKGFLCVNNLTLPNDYPVVFGTPVGAPAEFGCFSSTGQSRWYKDKKKGRNPTRGLAFSFGSLFDCMIEGTYAT